MVLKMFSFHPTKTFLILIAMHKSIIYYFWEAVNESTTKNAGKAGKVERMQKWIAAEQT